MDLGTIIGAIAGLVLIFITILLTGVPFPFYFSISSLIMVIGGSFAAMLVGNPASRLLGIMRFARHSLRSQDWNTERVVADLVEFAGRARREGILSLEDYLEEVDDEYMRRGLQLVVDGTDPTIIRDIMLKELEKIQERHEIGVKIFDDWGKLAPAFGLIGTLIGLVAMLANLDDRSTIGVGLALALLTTMYGAIFANLILLPIRSKLEDRNLDELLVREITLEGVLSIQSGDNPRILMEKLVSFLPPDKREEIYNEFDTRSQAGYR